MEQTKQFTTSRGLLKYILFTIITLGIYPLVMYSLIANELNKICKDGKSTMQYWIVFLLSPFALGIPMFVWFHRVCNRLGAELEKRGVNYSVSASTFWGWMILGSFIAIGPLVFVHKFLKASNRLNANYNERGE